MDANSSNQKAVPSKVEGPQGSDEHSTETLSSTGDTDDKPVELSGEYKADLEEVQKTIDEAKAFTKLLEENEKAKIQKPSEEKPMK